MSPLRGRPRARDRRARRRSWRSLCAPSRARGSGAGWRGSGRGLLDQAVPDRVDRGLRAVRYVQLLKDRGDVTLHGLRREDKLVRDLAVAQALGDEREDLTLAFGEVARGRGSRRAGLQL